MNSISLRAACVAEFIGTFILIFFGLGSVHVAVLLDGLSGAWQIGIVWGMAIMFAIYVCGPISGAHINPAMTIGFAFWKLFPWSRVVPYVVSQLAGAITAAAVLFVLFNAFLSAKETAEGVTRGQPGSEITAMCYGEYFPDPGGLTKGDAVYDAEKHSELKSKISEPIACMAEILGTAILALVVISLTDSLNVRGPKDFAPVFIGLTVTGLICVIAPLTQACFNPARDFGPRLFAYFAGWGDVVLPGQTTSAFVTVYIMSPIIGSILGMGVFQLVLRKYYVQVEQNA